MEKLGTIVRFNLQYQAKAGEVLFVTGSLSVLGEWKASKAIRMQCLSGHIWKCRITIPTGEPLFFDYKYVIMNMRTGIPKVEQIPKRCFQLESASNRDFIVQLTDQWGIYTQSQQVLPRIKSNSLKGIVILGNKLLPDGSPSEILQGRMRIGIRTYFEDPKNCILLLTGGKVQDGENIRSEAEVMCDIAISHGIPKHAIILEDRSMNTIENAFNSRDLLEEIGIASVIVVTSDFHIPRSKRIFDDVLGSDYQIEYKESHTIMGRDERLMSMIMEAKRLPTISERVKTYTYARL